MLHYMDNLDNLNWRQKDLKVLKKYNEIFSFLSATLWDLLPFKLQKSLHWDIVSVQRWLVNWSNQIFRDYLSSTHHTMEERFANFFWNERPARCVKLKFWSWETFIFSKDCKKIDWVENFDKYYFMLNDNHKTQCDALFIQLSNIENSHFKSDEYQSVLSKIKKTSIQDIGSILNIEY